MFLFDSLYRGLPIGHMLVWKARETFKTRRYAHVTRGRAQSRDNFYGYLLDGQQRLTAISFVKDGHDDYRLLLNLWSDIDKYPDYGDPFYWFGSWAEGDPWIVTVAEVLQDKFDPLAYLARLRQDEEYKEVYEKTAYDRLIKLQKILDYQIGITEFESESYAEATELFIRFNSMGRKLNKSDLAVAQLALKVPGLTSDEMTKDIKGWEPAFRFTRPFLIQCLAAVHTERMSVKEPARMWQDAGDSDIRNAWKKTARAISEVVEFLTGTVRWDSAVWLPSFNALIPLIVIAANGGSLNKADRERARAWLILASLRSYFSGSVYTQLDRVLKKLGNKPSVGKLWNNTRKRLGRVKPEDFETNRLSGPAMALFVSMIRNVDARDWQRHTPLTGTVLGHNAKLQVHHFFPRALLRREKVAATDIDNFANYSILSKGTNLHLATEEPATYLKRERIDNRELDKQCIPTDPDLWRVGRYQDFLTARRRLLAQRANEFLGL